VILLHRGATTALGTTRSIGTPPTFSVYEERMHGWVRIPGDVTHRA
jgi:hypothetical protein